MGILKDIGRGIASFAAWLAFALLIRPAVAILEIAGVVASFAADVVTFPITLRRSMRGEGEE